MNTTLGSQGHMTVLAEDRIHRCAFWHFRDWKGHGFPYLHLNRLRQLWKQLTTWINRIHTTLQGTVVDYFRSLVVRRLSSCGDYLKFKFEMRKKEVLKLLFRIYLEWFVADRNVTVRFEYFDFAYWQGSASSVS